MQKLGNINEERSKVEEIDREIHYHQKLATLFNFQNQN
jgi:hypothetical protein